MWAYSFEQNWREAYRFADLLCKESKWSQVTYVTFSPFALLQICSRINMIALLVQAVYVFQKAAILSMLPEEQVTELGENVVELFRCARVHTIRLQVL